MENDRAHCAGKRKPGAGARSPRYPSIGLRKALELTRAIWDNEKRTTVTPEVAAKHFGYNSLSGPVRSQIGALRQFGLLEGSEDGIKLSEAAIALMAHPADSMQYRGTLIQVALKPELFREIHANFTHASDASLRAYLITKKRFTEEGAEALVKAYRETIELAKLDKEPYNDSEQPKEESEESMDQIEDKVETGNTRKVITRSFSWPLSPDVTAEVRITGSERIKPAHFEILRQYLNLAKVAIGGGLGDPESTEE